MSRSLNKVMLIGNLTKDPDIRMTQTGTQVANFVVATNRSWKDAAGQEKEESTFTKIIAWQKLAELCGKLLTKGAKIYLEGRLANRTWQDKAGATHYETEIVMDEMILLSSQKMFEQKSVVSEVVEDIPPEPPIDISKESTEDIKPEDIPV